MSDQEPPVPAGRDNQKRKTIGLPMRPFLFTTDQIETLLGVPKDALMRKYFYLDGIHEGTQPSDRMLAHNIAPEGERADWRVSEAELVRWTRHKGFFIYDRGWVLD